MVSPARQVAEWMGRHHGVITLGRARSSGMTAGEVRWLLATGQWQRLHRGVYAAAASPATPHRALLAATAAGGPGSEATHRAGAWLRGLYDDPPTPEITIPHSRVRAIPGVTVHRAREVPPGHTIAGVPTPTVPVLLRGLATTTSDAELLHVVDKAFAAKLIRPAALLRAARTDPRHAGSRRLVEHLVGRGFDDRDDVVAPTVSESVLWRLAREAGMPPPEREVAVPVDGHTYLLDTAYPHLMVAFEADGHASHSSPEQISRDHDRRAAIRRAGWDLDVFTHRDLTGARRRVVSRMQRTYAAHGGVLFEGVR